VVPDTIGGRYRLVERLSGGGMADVWVAQDSQLDRLVVIKLLGPGADRARFEREAHAVAALSHTNICLLYDYGAEDGRPYMVFEHLPGGTLEDRFRSEQPLADADAARIAAEVAAALAHAHAQGVVHRDLKPANVLFDEEGRAKVADFGVARMSGADTLTEDGTLIGTAAYMSPEQAAGEPATEASDVYSFGVVLYRMLTGRLPFDAPDALEVARSHREEAATPVTSLRADAPPVLAALAEDAMAKQPAARPRDGEELLDRLHEGAPIAAAAEATAVTNVIRRPPVRRLPLPLVALFGALVLAAAGVALAVMATRGGSEPKPLAPSNTQRTTVGSTEPETTEPTTTRSESTTTASTQTQPIPPPPPPPPPPQPPPPPPPPPPEPLPPPPPEPVPPPPPPEPLPPPPPPPG
jgi:serine/threonine protein kinase